MLLPHERPRLFRAPARVRPTQRWLVALHPLGVRDRHHRQPDHLGPGLRPDTGDRHGGVGHRVLPSLGLACISQPWPRLDRRLLGDIAQLRLADRSPRHRHPIPLRRLRLHRRPGPFGTQRADPHPDGLGDDRLPDAAGRTATVRYRTGRGTNRRLVPDGLGFLPRPADGRRGLLDLELDRLGVARHRWHPAAELPGLVARRNRVDVRAGSPPAQGRPRCGTQHHAAVDLRLEHLGGGGLLRSSGRGDLGCDRHGRRRGSLGLETVEPAAVVSRLLPWLAVGATALTVHTAWNLRRLRRPSPPDIATTEKVAVLIPARDEATHIASTIDSARAQRWVPHLSIHVLDDGSTDGTAAIAESAAKDDPRIHVHRRPDEPPPPGWLGKNYACARLAEIAEDEGADILVFVDADVRLQASAVSALVHELRHGGFALVAPYPRQESIGWLERLVQPLLVWSWATTVPLGVAERRQWASMSVANGQLLVFDARDYRRTGGHAAVRAEVIEDVELMRAVRLAGLRAVTLDGSRLATCRMYESPQDLIDGYTKSAWKAFGGLAGSLVINSGLVAVYVVPAFAAVLGRGSTRAWGFAGYAAGVGGRFLVARRTGERTFPDTLTHPASILVFVAINTMSWWRHLTGTAQWKGRQLSS